MLRSWARRRRSASQRLATVCGSVLLWHDRGLDEEVFSEDVFIIGTLDLPVPYFLIWCSLQGSDNPKTSWIYYFGCLFVGYAVGGCSSIVVISHRCWSPVDGMAVATAQMFSVTDNE